MQPAKMNYVLFTYCSGNWIDTIKAQHFQIIGQKVPVV